MRGDLLHMGRERPPVGVTGGVVRVTAAGSSVVRPDPPLGRVVHARAPSLQPAHFIVILDSVGAVEVEET